MARKRRFSAKPRKPYDTSNRPATTFKCRWKPNRRDPRKFSERDAGRIACEVVREGRGTLAGITRHFRQVCKGTDERNPESQAAMEQAMSALAESDATMTDAFSTFNIINGLLTTVIVITTILGSVPTPAAVPLRLASRGAAIARVSVAQLITRMTNARAANQAAYNVLQRAAANERLFARAA